jgi:uncharacterized integral membrane protein
MLRKILNVLVVLPLAIIFIVFAVANRHLVMLSFDPFDSTDAALGLSLPLFVVIIAFTILGVLAGGIATWFGQRRWRRAARLNETEARNARAQLADLRGRSQTTGQFGEAQVPAARRDSGLSAVQSPQYGAIVRDKSGATL